MVKRKREKHQTTNELVISSTSTGKQCVNIDINKPYKKKLPCWTEYNIENGKPATTSEPLSKSIINKEHNVANLNRHAGTTTNTSETMCHEPGTIVQLQSDTLRHKPGTDVQLQSNKFREQKRQNFLSLKVDDKEELTQKNIKDARLIPRIKEYLDRRTDESYVSIPQMVDYLRSKYPEYGRRKRSFFKNYVNKAYLNIKTLPNLKKNEESGTTVVKTSENGDYKFKKVDDIDPVVFEENDISFEDLDTVAIAAEVHDDDLGSDSHEVEMMPELVEYKDSNAINSMLSNLYRNSPSRSLILEYDKKLDKNTVSEVTRPIQDNAVQVNLMQATLASTDFDGCPTVKKGNRLNMVNVTNLSFDQSESRGRSVQQASDNIDTKISDGLCTTKDRLSMLRKFCDDIGDHIGIENVGISESSTQSLLSEHCMEMGMEIANTKKQTLPKSNDYKKVTRKSTVKRQVEKTEDEAKISKIQKIGSKIQQQADNDTEKSQQVKGPVVQRSTVTFADVGGNEDNLIEICKLLMHMRHPEVYQQLGITPLRGLLLHGPPGCGKTLLANAIAGELDLPLIKIAATEIVSGVSGDSEEKIRDLFQMALQSAPCMLFIDEIDSITPKRETASKDMERRIVAQLLTCMDALNANVTCQVLVIGATNRPDALDPGLRRAGRFDREICLGIPDESSRLRILQVLCRNQRLSPGFEFAYLARNTPGYVGADLMALAREAAMIAVNRVFQNLQCDKNTPVRENNTIVLTDTNNIDKHSTVTQNNCSSIIVSQAQCNDNPLTLDADDIQVSLTTETPCVNQTQQSYADSNRILTDNLTSNFCEGVIYTVDKIDSRSVTVELPCVSVNMETMVTNGDIADINAALVSGCDTVNMAEQHKMEIFNSVPVTMEHFKHMSQKAAELTSALSWLKEHPPLTEEQLKDLFITLDDFKEALKCVQPSAKREGFATIPDVTWDDIGALKDIREKLELTILAPVRYPELFKGLGLTRAQGVMLAGPPGCGKTLLAKAVANETGINFISVKGPELLNMYVGESERAVRTVFQRARNSAPCVIFFDELDALCPRRSGSSEGNSSARVVNQLLTEMDGLEERKQVFIMAATNRPDIIDPAVLRPGRLDKTLYVGFPTVSDRLDILKCITKNGTRPQLSPDVKLATIAEDQRCDCFTGADLSLLVREASENALKDAIFLSHTQPTNTILVTQANFEAALKSIKPSVSIKDQERYRNMKNILAVE